tara:strand:+ start:97 stop:501 length:405 start_codon:yes stop_codon:yes gene_type:complete
MTAALVKAEREPVARDEDADEDDGDEDQVKRLKQQLARAKPLSRPTHSRPGVLRRPVILSPARNRPMILSPVRNRPVILRPLVTVAKNNVPVDDGDDDDDDGDGHAAMVKHTSHKPGPTVTSKTRRQHRSLTTP